MAIGQTNLNYSILARVPYRKYDIIYYIGTSAILEVSPARHLTDIFFFISTCAIPEVGAAHSPALGHNRQKHKESIYYLEWIEYFRFCGLILHCQSK